MLVICNRHRECKLTRVCKYKYPIRYKHELREHKRKVYTDFFCYNENRKTQLVEWDFQPDGECLNIDKIEKEYKEKNPQEEVYRSASSYRYTSGALTGRSSNYVVQSNDIRWVEAAEPVEESLENFRVCYLPQPIENRSARQEEYEMAHNLRNHARHNESIQWSTQEQRELAERERDGFNLLNR